MSWIFVYAHCFLFSKFGGSSYFFFCFVYSINNISLSGLLSCYCFRSTVFNGLSLCSRVFYVCFSFTSLLVHSQEWKVLLANKTSCNKGDAKDAVAKNTSSASVSSTTFNESSKHLSQSSVPQKSTSSGTANSSIHPPTARKQLLPDEV